MDAYAIYLWLGLLFSGLHGFVRCTRLKNARGTVPLTDAEKMQIVKYHNTVRRSSGSSDMRYMTWDSELEWIAERYGEKCRYRHNVYRNSHSTYSSVGENIYATDGKLSTFDVRAPVQKWYNEVSDFNFNTRQCATRRQCGHYTQIVWATTFKVGCALTVCDRLSEINFGESLLFICNYATAGNVVHGLSKKLTTVFKKGKACSECDDGDYCREWLCANSKRDFIPMPESPGSSSCTNSIAFIVTIAVLSFALIVVTSYILYRRFKPYFQCRKPKSVTMRFSPKKPQTNRPPAGKECDVTASIQLVERVPPDNHVDYENNEIIRVHSQTGRTKVIPPPPKIAPPPPPVLKR